MPQPPPARAGWHPAPTDEDGNVIAVWLDLKKGHADGQKTRPQSIHEPYALLVLCREDWPEKGFYLFDNGAKSYFATRNFERFVGEVEALPDKAKLSWISTCTVPCEKGLPEAQRTRLLKTLEKKEIYDPVTEKCTGFEQGVCYCEGRLRFLDIPDEPVGEAGHGANATPAAPGLSPKAEQNN